MQCAIRRAPTDGLLGLRSCAPVKAAISELFTSGALRQLIPDDHVLVRVDRVLDLSWLRDEVADCYCLDDGRPGIDPEAAVRLCSRAC